MNNCSVICHDICCQVYVGTWSGYVKRLDLERGTGGEYYLEFNTAIMHAHLRYDEIASCIVIQSLVNLKWTKITFLRTMGSAAIF